MLHVTLFRKVKSFVVHEKKVKTPHRVIQEQGQESEIYSDHSAIMCSIKWKNEIKNNKDKEKKVMISKSYSKYKEIIQEQRISTTLLEGGKTLQEKYDKWMEQVLRIKEKCMIKAQKKQTSKNIRRLMRVKRKLKKERGNKISDVRRKLINKHIYREKYQTYAKKVSRAIEQLRRDGGGVKEESFWEFKRKLKGLKKETPIGMEGETGEINTEPRDIKEIYRKFYKNLFENPKVEEIREHVEKKMEQVKGKAKDQKPMIISKKVIRKVVSKLKRKKAGDLEGWNNEMIMEGGEEIIKSLEILFNSIHRTVEIPTQWEKMKIKSIYKNKGKKLQMKNRRGIFLTSVLGKVFEKKNDGRIGGETQHK